MCIRDRYQDIWYSAEEKDRVDDMLETKQTEKKISERKWNEEDKLVALAVQNKERCQKDMVKKFRCV